MTRELETLKADLVELDPSKFYLIFINLDKSGLTMYDVENIYTGPVTNVLFICTRGEDNDFLQIVEQP